VSPNVHRSHIRESHAAFSAASAIPSRRRTLSPEDFTRCHMPVFAVSAPVVSARYRHASRGAPVFFTRFAILHARNAITAMPRAERRVLSVAARGATAASHAAAQAFCLLFTFARLRPSWYAAAAPLPPAPPPCRRHAIRCRRAAAAAARRCHALPRRQIRCSLRGIVLAAAGKWAQLLRRTPEHGSEGR